MNEISINQIHKTYSELLKKSGKFIGDRPTIRHIRCTREAYANVYAYKVKKICRAFDVNYESVMCNEDVTTPTYLDVKEKITQANNSDCEGILFDTPFKQNSYLRAITSQIDQNKDIECMSPVNYGKFLLGTQSYIMPCITASINDLVYLHGIGYDYKKVLIITDIQGDNYGLGMTNTFNSPVITVAKPTDADFLATHFYEYDIIISLLYDSKICITKDTITTRPTTEQIVFVYGWCSETKDSTILSNIFNSDLLTYYDLSNGLMDMYIYNAIHNLFKRIVTEYEEE